MLAPDLSDDRARTLLRAFALLFLVCLTPSAEYGGAHAAEPLTSWTLTSSTAFQNHVNGLVAVDGRLYTTTFGGHVETATIEPGGSLGPWSTTTPPNISRHIGVLVAAGRALYLIGGWPEDVPASTYTTNGSVEFAKVNSDGTLSAWTFTSSLQVPRANHAAAVGGQRIYAFSNYAGSTDVESAVILSDGSLGPWRFETSTLDVRERPTAAVVGGHLYAIGGLRAPGWSSVERAPIGADGELGPWERMTAMSTGRYYPVSAAIGDVLFAFGGYNDWDGPLRSVERALAATEGLGAWSFDASTILPRAIGTAAGRTLYGASLSGPGTDAQLRSIEYARLPPLDADDDGIDDSSDNCPATPNADQSDADGDGRGDACDSCPRDASDDSDHDAWCADSDNCPAVANPAQQDRDGDGAGDACDDDADGDGISDAEESSLCVGTAPGIPTSGSGCSVEQTCPCGHPWGRTRWLRRSEYRGCVRNALTEMRQDDRLNPAQQKAILAAARSSSCGLP